jgi:hypothetical protein
MATVTPTTFIRLQAAFHAEMRTNSAGVVKINTETKAFAGAFGFSQAGNVSITYSMIPAAMSTDAARFIAWVEAQHYIQVVSRGTAESGNLMQDYAKERLILIERTRFLEAKAVAAEAATLVVETRLLETEAVNTRLRRENGDCRLQSDLNNAQQADTLNQLQMDNNRLLRMEILRGEEVARLQADITERDKQNSGMAAYINRITRVNTQLDATNSALVVANATLTDERRSAKGGGGNAIASVLKSTVDLIAAGVSAVSPTTMTNAVNSAGEAVGRLLKRKRED